MDAAVRWRWRLTRLVVPALIAGALAMLAVGASAQTDDDLASATRVELPSDTEGEIAPGDDDWFRFEVAARGKVTVGLPISGYGVTVVLYDAGGEEAATDPLGGEYRWAHIKRTLDAGTYYVRVTSRVWEVRYVLRLLDGSEDDHGDDRASATRVELPSETAGEIDNIVDDDWFRFEVAAREEVAAGTTSDETDFEAFLLDADGNTLASDYDNPRGDNVRLWQTLDAGTYYVRITSALGASDTQATGSYVLHIRSEDDYGDSLATATRVELPSQTSGSIDFVDTDWFRFEVPANGVVTADTAHSNPDRTGAFLGRLYNVIGNELAFNGTYNRESRSAVQSSRLDAGTYYVQIEHYRDNGVTGNYVLRLTFEEDEQTGPLERLRRRLRTLGDFNGDGKDDVLLRHAGGRWHYYPMNGRQVLADSGVVGLTRDLAWQIAGIGDFDGNGRDDVLLRKTDGRWYFYPMDGRTVLDGRGTVRLTWDLAWQVAGIADFDGDGTDDVLLRHEDGRWHFYRMNGRRPLAGSGPVSMTADLAWQMAGVGDFDGDGREDVLLRRRDDGRWHFHPMNGGEPIAGHGGVGLTQDLAWGMVGVGDFDADGRHDVLLRHVDGRWRYHPMQGAQLLDGAGLVNLTEDTSTTAAGIGDLNGDGRADVLARLANGSWYYSAMDGRRILSASGEAALADDLAWGVLTGGPPPGTFRDCAECPLMVRVPPGTFTMGAPESEPHSEANERPQRTISVRGFAAGVYEVTFAEWDACVSAGGCAAAEHDEGWGRGDRPVIWVSFDAVQSYIDWLSSTSGQRYRLLTEFEWEYAARAGTTTPFHTGETITPQQANFDGQDYLTGESGLDRRQTVPVGSFAPNGFGLYDVHGNVWEWVQGCLGRCGPWRRIVRGGGWASPAKHIRSALRGNSGGFGYFNTGFRVARTL